MTADVSSKLKTALICVSIAVAFFVGVVVRHWTW
jgi:hypothetical protein